MIYYSQFKSRAIPVGYNAHGIIDGLDMCAKQKIRVGHAAYLTFAVTRTVTCRLPPPP